MRKILITVFASFFTLIGFAQQDPQFSQNAFIKMPVNPGYAGTSDAICATAAYRTQWVGFPGAPKTFLFTADAPVTMLHGGAGLTVMNDQLGNFNFILARGAYSFHQPVGATGILGAGLEVGLLQSSVKYNWLAPDGTTGGPDQAIPDAGVKKSTYDLGFGLYYRTQQLYVGLSSSHLPEQNLKDQEFNYEVARHYYIMAGYDFFLTSKFTLRPNVHVKSDVAVTAFDAHVNILYDNMIWLGASYRLQDAIVPMLGFAWNPNQKSTFKIGYAYDLGTSNLKAYHDNTHEIMVNYCIKLNPQKKTSSHVNPRFLR